MYVRQCVNYTAHNMHNEDPEVKTLGVRGCRDEHRDQLMARVELAASILSARGSSAFAFMKWSALTERVWDGLQQVALYSLVPS
jgi:hypothetical protein